MSGSRLGPTPGFLKGSSLRRFLKKITWIALTLAALGGACIGIILTIIYRELPSIEAIRDIRLKEPLRIYTIDGRLIAEYGNKKRITTTMDQVPGALVNAILAAEDDGFFDHYGVDFAGIARAVLANLRAGGIDQGASTITMQVARNYFLTREKTYTRKIKEVLLALTLEQALSKNEILELYLNKIFLGHRAYGFQAAASVYYDRRLKDLTLAQLAMLAGLPKAPSRGNPLANPAKAVARRDYVLRRMRDLGMIDARKFQLASSSPVSARKNIAKIEVDSSYLAEMARDYMVDHYGEEAYLDGYRVFTTISSDFQGAANRALRTGLMSYDRRHSYRGPVDRTAAGQEKEPTLQISKYRSLGKIVPAIVSGATHGLLDVTFGDGSILGITKEGWGWTGTTPDRILRRGDVVYVDRTRKKNFLAQLPEIQGALVSLSPVDGAVLALVGGFDFFSGKFNRAIQARRQPGSNIKPFIYSAALDNGFTAATLVSGAPIVIESSHGDTWRPQNYSKKVFGPTRLRKALSKSLNLVSVRLVRAMGTEVVRDHLENFGFERADLPDGLSLALGSATVTPMEIARGYAVFANGGYLVQPYFIARVEDQSGNIVEYSNRVMLCPDCEPADISEPRINNQRKVDPRYARRALSPENAFIMNSLMGEVIKTGTGRRANSLGRGDLAGKTGTTNNFRDAWFSGFNQDVVTTVWVGFDQPHNLGERESGARAALPIWIDYMSEALAGKPEKMWATPENVITVSVNHETGNLTSADDPDGYEEFFVMGTEPRAQATGQVSTDETGHDPTAQVDELF